MRDAYAFRMVEKYGHALIGAHITDGFGTSLVITQVVGYTPGNEQMIVMYGTAAEDNSYKFETPVYGGEFCTLVSVSPIQTRRIKSLLVQTGWLKGKLC